MRAIHLLAAILVSFVATLWPSWIRSAEFQGLGDLPGGWWTDARAMSADGSVVTGATLSDGHYGQGFVWTKDRGLESLGALPGGDVSLGLAISGDGRVVVGSSNTPTRPGRDEAFRWTREGGMEGLGDLPGGIADSMAFGASFYGNVVVGMSNARDLFTYTTLGYEAFRWTEPEGMQILGEYPRFHQNLTARAVSDDGKSVIGADGTRSYHWTESEGFQVLSSPYPRTTGIEARALSGDGRTAAGWFHYVDPADPSTILQDSFRWTADTGLIALSTAEDPRSSAAFFDASRDGSILVGQQWVGGGIVASVWDQYHGLRPLADVLKSGHGLENALAGWRLERAFAVSADGLVIAGTGINPEGHQEGWRVSLNALPLPTLLPGDATLDGVVDLGDFGRLKAQLGKGGFWYQGNFNEDAKVDLADFGVLKANFGRSVSTAIPEPPAWLLAALAAIGCVASRRGARE